MEALAERVRHVRVVFPGYEGCFALLSGATGPNVKRAVIFVHGFAGSAKTTFADFLSLVDDDETADRWWESADLYFYHYHLDSIFRKVPENKIRLANFIDQIYPEPPQQMFAAGAAVLRNDFKYEDLVLVGHSEGGLLLRKVIVDVADSDERIENYKFGLRFGQTAAEPEPRGLEKASMRLFAPAIGGESVTGILGLLCNLPVISLVPKLAGAKVTMNAQATSVSVPRSATDEYTDYLKMPCFRAHILWADRDQIVVAEKYRRDSECRNRPLGSSHTSVCKPKRNYLLPIKFVQNGVRDGKC